MAYQVCIRVMGSTGSGKTTFINLASGSDLRVGAGLESCTNEVQTSVPFGVDGQTVVLIDTPGFDDTTMMDTDVLKLIAAYLVTTYEQGAKLAGIIYMHRISDVRMGGTSKRNFRIFRELCGDSTLRNVLIVTNMWSNVDPKVGEDRERELASNDKFFKPVLEKGARMLRHDGTQASTHAILRYLINNQAATLRIQHEIVNEHRDLAHTSAGAELTRALKEQEERHNEELRKLRSEMEAALRAKDEETRGELQDEVDKKREEIARIQHDAERMAADFNAEKSRLEARIAQMEEENRRHLQELGGLQDKLQRQAKVREEEERARLKQEEQEKAHLQEEIARARAEMKKVAAEQERRDREAAAARQADAEAHARLLEEQRQAAQRAKEVHER
ncbi:P-loop containing nucleoside triphosphate hydrolase protein, partial [Phlebopus sp. FC_14]